MWRVRPGVCWIPRCVCVVLGRTRPANEIGWNGPQISLCDGDPPTGQQDTMRRWVGCTCDQAGSGGARADIIVLASVARRGGK